MIIGILIGWEVLRLNVCVMEGWFGLDWVCLVIVVDGRFEDCWCCWPYGWLGGCVVLCVAVWLTVWLIGC